MSSNRNTILFGASLLAAVGAVSADHLTSAAPAPKVASQEESFNPCAAAVPSRPGQRNYDSLADTYSRGAAAPAPAPAPAAAPAALNPCSAGAI
ncbi:hypothetical protein [Nitratireductor aestuarii]|uniref:hypothetical protein n=1 Tax=Nitratireductor aestuarii TaxID=1735103 RepID=UPI00166BF23B|nr:hypothetical protein [Nitratireductor aestuarii]